MKGRDVRIRTHARVLREVQAPAGAAPALHLTPCDATPSSIGHGHWGQADVRRAIAAAEKAGLKDYRIEIAPDGTISIVVGN